MIAFQLLGEAVDLDLHGVQLVLILLERSSTRRRPRPRIRFAAGPPASARSLAVAARLPAAPVPRPPPWPWLPPPPWLWPRLRLSPCPRPPARLGFGFLFGLSLSCGLVRWGRPPSCRRVSPWRRPAPVAAGAVFLGVRAARSGCADRLHSRHAMTSRATALPGALCENVATAWGVFLPSTGVYLCKHMPNGLELQPVWELSCPESPVRAARRVVWEAGGVDPCPCRRVAREAHAGAGDRLGSGRDAGMGGKRWGHFVFVGYNNFVK